MYIIPLDVIPSTVLTSEFSGKPLYHPTKERAANTPGSSCDKKTDQFLL